MEYFYLDDNFHLLDRLSRGEGCWTACGSEVWMDMLDGYAATEHAIEETELCEGTLVIIMHFNFTRIVCYDLGNGQGNGQGLVFVIPPC